MGDTPSDHCYTVIQDHGPSDGGWGPAAMMIPRIGYVPRPIVYTGEQEHVIEAVRRLCEQLAEDTGKPTRLVRYSHREDVASFGESP